MKSAGFIAAALCALLLAVPALSPAFPFAGLTVTQLVIQDDLGRPLPVSDSLKRLIVVEPGSPFSRAVIREGISYLYLTGRFRDIRVEGFPDAGGVKLVYTMVPVTIVDEIAITGNHALSKSRITDALAGIRDRELREDRFPDYRTGIRTVYQSEGYYGTGVDFTVERMKESHRVVLRVHITEPRRTVIAAIDFSGNSVFTKKQLLKVMKSRPGKPLRTDVLFDEDLAAIQKKYDDAGYPAAKPGPVNISFRDDKAYVLIAGKEGPKVSVAFTGNSAFGGERLEKQLLIRSDHDVSDAIIDSSADKIKTLYRETGYDQVKVTVRKNQSPGRLDFIFDIQEGRRVTVREIIIRGNRYFPEKQLKNELLLQESGWFSSSPFRAALADKSAEYLRERYLDAGFLSVEVKKEVEVCANGKAIVRFDITEGPQTLTGLITFAGNRELTEAELRDRVSLRQGELFNERLVEEGRYRILSVYSDKGFLYARVEVEKREFGGRIDIHYTIDEDQPVRIGRIILRGNERTRESVIMRELLLKPGVAYNYEDILKTQQRIYRFGYFNLARFEPVHAGEKEYVKDMLLTLEERPAGSVEIGAGYGDLDRARAFLEVSHRNLWGLAHYAGVRFERSDILERAILNYQHPWFFSYDLQGKFALTWSDAKEVNADTRDIYYQTRQASASYGLEKKLNRLKVSLTYAFESVENYNVQQGVDVPEQDKGHVRVSSLSPALVWDLRDDIFNPRRGSLYGVVLKEAMHELGSEADFTKVSAHSSWYIPAGSNLVTALSARAGMAWPHHETAEIPLHERFYLGGSTSVRGYNYKTVGPMTDQGTPTGGSSMVQFNMELRLMLSRGLGFVLFTDAGNVWEEQKTALGDLRASYGAGIRYVTPVGPLRIDYGRKINRRPEESPGEFHINIGHTF